MTILNKSFQPSTVRSIYNLSPNDLVLMNTSPSSSDLYPTKYLGYLPRLSGQTHVFIPLHESGEYIEEYDTCNECDVVYLNSLDELNNYIITEVDSSWFVEHMNQEGKTHYTIKQDYKPDLILDLELDQIIPSNDALPRWSSFEKLLTQPNDPLRPITVTKDSNGIFYVVDGNHRIEYSREKGYTQIPAILHLARFRV